MIFLSAISAKVFFFTTVINKLIHAGYVSYNVLSSNISEHISDYKHKQTSVRLLSSMVFLNYLFKPLHGKRICKMFVTEHLFGSVTQKLM